jgi:phosphate:Na+ symporter
MMVLKGMKYIMVMKELVIPLATGLAIFLFGMHTMRIGFEQLFLVRVKSMLERLTRTPLLGLVTGLLVTALLQSSSAVMLLVIGLAHSGILSFRHTLGIILGANIGTVITSELIAISIDDLAIYLFVLGAVLFLFSQIQIRNMGLVIGGFGLLLIGMEIMQAVTSFLKTFISPLTAEHWINHHVLGAILVGTLFTAVIQSSTATTVITMSLVHDGLLTLKGAIGVVLGSNIGTCATALLGSMATNETGRRVAIAHLLLNALGVLVFIPLTPVFQLVVERLADNAMLQVAHAQALFNIICSLIALPFVPFLERLVIWITSRSRKDDRRA